MRQPWLQRCAAWAGKPDMYTNVRIRLLLKEDFGANVLFARSVS